MSPEQLLNYFDRISDASEAIPRLRGFILDLAVRGKLVPQAATDQPASELIKTIYKEKARLGMNGEVASKREPLMLRKGTILSRFPEIGSGCASPTC